MALLELCGGHAGKGHVAVILPQHGGVEHQSLLYIVAVQAAQHGDVFLADAQILAQLGIVVAQE